MKTKLFVFLLVSSATAAFGQTTAKEYYAQGFRKAFSDKSSDIDAAIADMSMAIKLKPDYDDAYNQRAILKSNKDDLAGALSDYSKAIELRPNFATYYSNRAGIRAELKDFSGALADCSKVIELKPKDYHAYLKRGEIRLKQKDHTGAIKDFNLALQVKPDYFAVLKPRAAAYRALGQSNLAEADEKKYAAEMKIFMERLLKP